MLRYAPGQNFNGSLRDIAGRAQRAGNVFGLMPHPEHAVDELTAARPTGCGSSVDAPGGGRRRRDSDADA